MLYNTVILIGKYTILNCFLESCSDLLLQCSELLLTQTEHGGPLGVVVALHVPVDVSYDADDGGFLLPVSHGKVC